MSAVAIAAGLAHSCALTSAGGVKCWGTNGHDEVGDGTSGERWTPVDVSGMSSGVAAIAAGVRHSCALSRAAGVRCWGNNGQGALGDGTVSRRFTPVNVSGLSTSVTAIAAGSDHSCAVMSSGGVKCWGYNRFGELGDGTTTDRLRPVDVSGLGSGVVTAVAAGGFHSCALTSSGGVRCWGANGSGRLGDGTTSDRSTPVDVAGLNGGVAAIAAGSGHSCALTGSGGVKCWGGNNAFGTLGDGTTSNHPTPVGVSGLSRGVTAIAAGSAHNCALTSLGGVKCWGLNDHGQLGDGTTTDRLTPVDVSGLGSGVAAIAAGSFHSCALTRTRGVRCWGLNGSGQLGNGTTVSRRSAVGVVGFGAAKATVAIVSRSAAVTRRRVASVKLRCGSQARCQGTLTLIASGRVQVELGRRAFSIGVGRTQAVEVALTDPGFELLVRVKRLSTRARISYRQPAGGTTTETRIITLTAPKVMTR